MCRILLQTGMCQDAKCGFAHHLSEIRATDQYFKSAMCRFLRRGTCKLGRQCRYAHSPSELRYGAEPDEHLLRSEPEIGQLASDISFLEGSETQDCPDFSHSAAAEAPAPAGMTARSEWDQQDKAERFQPDIDTRSLAQGLQGWSCPSESMQNHGVDPYHMGRQGPPQSWRHGTSLGAGVQPDRLPGPWSHAHTNEQVQSLGCTQGQRLQQPACQPQHSIYVSQGACSSLQQPTCQEQHSIYELRGACGNYSCTGMQIHAARQQGVSGGMVRAPLTPHGSQLASSNVLMTASSSAALGAPASSLAWRRASPITGADGTRGGANFGIADVPFGRRAPAYMVATPDQPPSWEPTIPRAGVSQDPPENMQVAQQSDAVPTDPTSAYARDLQASILNAAAPEHYED